MSVRPLVVLLVSLVALALAAGAGAEPKPVSVTDPAGDSGAAPDLTGASVATDGALLLFSATVANPDSLAGDALVVFALETDGNLENGLQGLDVFVFADAEGASPATWNGTEFVPASFAAAGHDYAGGVLTVALRRADLGRPKALVLATFSILGEEADYAPDDDALLYRVPTLARADATFNGQARSGRRFGVTGVGLTLSDGSTARAGARTCTATLGGRALGPRNACSWALPRSAKGKTLVVVVRSSLDGENAPPRTYRFKVR